jgi:hypothetical protein
MAHHLLKADFTSLVTSEKEHSEASLSSIEMLIETAASGINGAFSIQQSHLLKAAFTGLVT